MRVDHLTSVNLNLQSEIQKLAAENARLKWLTGTCAVVAVLLGVVLLGRPW